jgi:hypothetical protein
VPQWFLVGILLLTTVFVLNAVWASRNAWFASRSSEFTSLAPHIRQLFELGRDAARGDNDKVQFAELFEFLSDLLLSSALAHVDARRLLDRTMRQTLGDLAKGGIEVLKLFEDEKYERSRLFLRTVPS